MHGDDRTALLEENQEDRYLLALDGIIAEQRIWGICVFPTGCRRAWQSTSLFLGTSFWAYSLGVLRAAPMRYASLRQSDTFIPGNAS
jgi:hypothetical protein